MIDTDGQTVMDTYTDRDKWINRQKIKRLTDRERRRHIQTNGQKDRRIDE